jgi:hypothetical protein
MWSQVYIQQDICNNYITDDNSLLFGSDGVETFFRDRAETRDIEKPVSSRDSCLEDSITAFLEVFYAE